jgi:dsDNA-specific endonuclease/ATPase MutS2
MINSLKYTQNLEAVGFTRSQAETAVTMVSETMQNFTATKADLKEMEFALRTDMQATHAELRQELQEFRSELKQEIQEVRSELKQEIQEVRSELKQEIQEVRTDIQDVRHEMKQLESRMTLRLGGLMVTGITLLGTLGVIQLLVR